MVIGGQIYGSYVDRFMVFKWTDLWFRPQGYPQFYKLYFLK